MSLKCLWVSFKINSLCLGSNLDVSKYTQSNLGFLEGKPVFPDVLTTAQVARREGALESLSTDEEYTRSFWLPDFNHAIRVPNPDEAMLSKLACVHGKLTSESDVDA